MGSRARRGGEPCQERRDAGRGGELRKERRGVEPGGEESLAGR